MKRFFILILAVAMVLSITACSNLSGKSVDTSDLPEFDRAEIFFSADYRVTLDIISYKIYGSSIYIKGTRSMSYNEKSKEFVKRDYEYYLDLNNVFLYNQGEEYIIQVTPTPNP